MLKGSKLSGNKKVFNTCNYCHKKFKSRRGAKFCSDSCRNKDWIEIHPRINLFD